MTFSLTKDDVETQISAHAIKKFPYYFLLKHTEHTKGSKNVLYIYTRRTYYLTELRI